MMIMIIIHNKKYTLMIRGGVRGNLSFIYSDDEPTLDKKAFNKIACLFFFAINPPKKIDAHASC